MIKRSLYFSTPAYLSLRNKQLVVSMPEVECSDRVSELIRRESVRTFPIEDVGIVVLDHARITITQGLLAALLAAQVAVITCDGRSLPTGLMLPLTGNSIQNERFRAQLNATLPLRKQLWQQTIRAKIANQAACLSTHTTTPTGCMEAWSDKVRSGDPDNLEARAAAYYWRHLFVDYQQHFIRDREGAPPNNLLNYGYAILRAIIARALVSSGLLPTLGIHHHNRYNAYCLADDIMEPYRPFVDHIVVDIMRSGTQIDTLDRDLKYKLMGIATADVCINDQRSPLMVAATTTTASLAKCFNGESRRLLYPDYETTEI